MKRVVVRSSVIKLSVISVLLISATAIVLIHPSRSFSQSKINFKQNIQPFFANNCYACHGVDVQESGLNLETYQTEAALKQDKATLSKVLEKLQTGAMPPKGMPRPDQAEMDAVVKWI